MENRITIYTNSIEDLKLYKQLAKRLNNRVEEKKNFTNKKKEKFLNDLSKSIREMKLHQEGKLELKTIEDVLDEL